MNVIGMYNNYLQEYPLITKTVTTGLVTAGGDLLCQKYFDGKVEKGRFLKFTFLGFVLVGPTLHYWYGFLGRRIPGLSITSVVYRVAADQFIFAPIFLAVFMWSVLLLDGKPEQIIPK